MKLAKHETHELRDLVDRREILVSKIAELTGEKRSKEQDIMLKVLDLGLVDCLQINWPRLYRSM